MRIGIAPGHSLLATPPQTYEHQRCLEVVARLAPMLRDAGHDVATPIFGDQPNDSALRAKVKYLNDVAVDCAVELHLNAGGGDYGLAVYWGVRNSYSLRGQRLARYLSMGMHALPHGSPPDDKFPIPQHVRAMHQLQRGSLYFLAATHAPSVLVEPAFMDGPPTHRDWITSPAFACDYAAAVYLGLRYYAEDSTL